MMGTEIELSTRDGPLAGLAFGGQGPDLLLVHGSGHNSAAWAAVASRLVGHCRPVAVDLRGHGQSGLDSSHPEQYWRDLGDVVASLGCTRPVLVGHSTGGYAVTAATAAGLMDPTALCVVDGMVLDDRATATAAQAAWSSAEASEWLRTTLRYGWVADDEQMCAYVEHCVRDLDTDWLNAGASPELVREVTRRGFLRRDDSWVRRPTIEEIAVISSADPGAAVYPSVELYERITCPLTLVLPDQGFSAKRRDEVRAVINAGSDRSLIDISANHNVPMTHPAGLAEIILDLLRRHTQ